MHKHNHCISPCHHSHNDHNHSRKEYARAFVIPQTYQNLFSVDEAIKRGTIFKDLYQPYHQKESINK